MTARPFVQMATEFAQQLAHVPIQQVRTALRITFDWMQLHSRWITSQQGELDELRRRVDELEHIVNGQSGKLIKLPARKSLPGRG